MTKAIKIKVLWIHPRITHKTSAWCLKMEMMNTYILASPRASKQKEWRHRQHIQLCVAWWRVYILRNALLGDFVVVRTS